MSGVEVLLAPKMLAGDLAGADGAALVFPLFEPRVQPSPQLLQPSLLRLPDRFGCVSEVHH